MSWKNLEDQQPQLASFGRDRLNGRIAYLATVRRERPPRVHPVSPIIGQGRLFVFMEPTSPKGRDLRLDGRYALCCSVSDVSGAGGEFIVRGRGRLVEDADVRALAFQLATYNPKERYLLFEFEVESAASTTYPEGLPVHLRWVRDS